MKTTKQRRRQVKPSHKNIKHKKTTKPRLPGPHAAGIAISSTDHSQTASRRQTTTPVTVTTETKEPRKIKREKIELST